VSATVLALLLAAAPLPAAAVEAPPAAEAPAPPEQATPSAVHSRTSRAGARLGEPIDWEVELHHGEGERYQLPRALPEGPSFRMEAVGCKQAPAAAPAVETVTTCALKVALLTLGPVDLPTLRLEVATPAGPRALDVPGPRLEGQGMIDPKVPADQLELRELAPPVPVMVPDWRPLWWALSAVAALLLAWRLWRWWRARARAAAEPPPPVAPERRFAARLDALEAEHLGEQGRGQEHFFRLSEAVREYLGALTGLNALDLTSAELLEALARAGDPRLELEPVTRFCRQADLVKFAKWPATGRDCADGLAFGRELLARTLPPPATPGGTA
jgi:hypothetical protein